VDERSDGWRADRIGSALLGTNPTVMAKLPGAFAVMGDVQWLLGDCVLLVDRPGVGGLNTDEFLHAHVWPRYDWEPAERVTKPVWLYPAEFWTLPSVRLGPQHDELRAALTAEPIRLGATAASS
jgi:hypothetical protein